MGGIFTYLGRLMESDEIGIFRAKSHTPAMLDGKDILYALDKYE